MDPRAANLLVFCASGAVLVLEILAVRMLAPYVGLTLENYTTIIGVVLAGIAAGSALGGRLADRVAPRLLLGPLLIAGGLLAMLTVPVVSVVGELADSGAAVAAIALALLSFGPPAAALSAVTPAVAKLELADLERSGSVVGRLSAWATGGALVGTFAAGFVLVPLVPVRATVLAVGGALALTGIALLARDRLAGRGAVAALLAGTAVLGGGGLALGSPCDAESAYFCAQVQRDPERPTGRVLVLDDLRHSYVDLEDPRRLEFPYVRWIADVIDARRPGRAVFLGGGGFTLPRYLAAVRPGARSVVLELDPELVGLVREELGLRTSEALRVRVGDARVSLRDEPTASADLVVGDAFGGLAVPWHLTTVQFLRDVRRVLRPGGIYSANLIDFGPLAFARAEAATLRRVFPHVALVMEREGRPGGNLVLHASERPLPLAALARRREVRVLGNAEVASFARGAPVLTDDRAPADQLLTPFR